MADPEKIAVRVVYALPDRQLQVAVEVAVDACVGDAVTGSGLMDRFPELQAGVLTCAIFGRAVALSDPLAAGDRVEILRELLVDPKESRRQAAELSRRRGAAPRKP